MNPIPTTPLSTAGGEQPASPNAGPSRTTGLPGLRGGFVDRSGENWYRIDGLESAEPFFMTLAGDSDLWAFVSSAGSLAAGRRDPEGAFLPYETVDKIHARWAHSGPRTWIRIHDDVSGHVTLWEPFARRLDGQAGARSVWKNLSGTRIRFREQHPSLPLVFQYEWFTAASLGLVRSARLGLAEGADPARDALRVSVLDGVLDLLPPLVGVRMSQTLSSLSDAYKWNESAAGGRLGLYTLYAQIWDRAEPKESFLALAAWHAGLPPGARTLLSAQQVAAFCRTGIVESETLTRGRRGAVLAQFELRVERPIDGSDGDEDGAGHAWHQVIDGPCSQVQAHALAQRLAAGGGTIDEIVGARQRNTEGVDELLARADGLQHSADAMAAAHHRANVLFNIMRGGVFVDGTRLERADLLAFARERHQTQGERLAALAAAWPETVEREEALAQVRARGDAGLERLVLEYLPLTFSRRHGDPSRPWNLFSIRVRDAQGRRLLGYQGNWRDIFQNWEALAPTAPDYLGSMIAVFLGAMTPDGYNPYRIGRDGIDWEVVSADDPWAHIGYWGDHQVIYLLRLMESAQAHTPGWLPDIWDRALFSFADIPYRLRPYADQVADPKHTIDFDSDAHEAAHARADRLGRDGLRVCDAAGEPLLATLGEKLAILLLAKAGSLVPGGGLWLHTQRPEWNDANNALAGYGLSVVSLAQLRRLLVFIGRLPGADRPFALSGATLQAVQAFSALLADADPSGTDPALSGAVTDPRARRAFMDRAGTLLDAWRAEAYRGAAGRTSAQAPEGLLTTLAGRLLPLVDATLAQARRPDGLFDSYNLLELSDGQAGVARLYPMLEGQVALLSCGWLSPAEAAELMDTLFASPLYTPERRSFLLYPDRRLPGFLERNRLDADALALPVVQRLLAEGRVDLLQRQDDGTVRFAPGLSSRADLEAAAAGLGDALPPLVQAYERVLGHHAFTGRSGTMFGYEGLGCIYWHMVAKLLLAVQENVFEAADQGAQGEAAREALKSHYRRVRDGLGYRKTAAEYGAFPADPYSHTPGEGGAQQPGMTGQVKEEILTRWGELGLRVREGRLQIDPLLLDRAELPADGALSFTWSGIAFAYRRGTATSLRVRRAGGWESIPDGRFDPAGVEAVELTLAD